MRLGSICRSGGYRFPRMISPRRWARPKSCSPIRRDSEARPRCRPVSCNGSPRSPAGQHGTRYVRVAQGTSPGRARSIGQRRQAHRPTGAQAAARGAARPPLRHRDRKLAARSLFHICQAHSARAPLEPSMLRPARQIAASSSMRALERVHQNVCGGLPADPAARADRDRSEAFRGAGGLSRSARFLVAALFAHRRAGLLPGRRNGATIFARSRPRWTARSRFRSASASLRFARAPTASSNWPEEPTPFSTTRPVRCRPRSRCASEFRPSSRWKPRSCATADFPILPPGHPSPRWFTSRSRAASRRRGQVDRVQEWRRAMLTPTRRSRKLTHGRAAIRGRAATLSAPGAVDVEKPLRQLRPPGARHGMVGRQR